MQIKIVFADYLDKKQAADLVDLLDTYAADLVGGGEGLDESVKGSLAATLAQIPHAFSLLCYVDDQPAGLVNCLEGFSTFKCKPLINIHDMVVVSAYRRLGLSQMLLAKVEEIARARGCCKITLEVLEGNKAAQRAYIKFGFEGYELDPVMGKALFWQKTVEST